MQTTDITCSYYNPCGDELCKDCNECRGCDATVLPNPFALHERLISCLTRAAPGGLSPSGGGLLNATMDTLFKPVAFHGSRERVDVDSKESTESMQVGLGVVRRASGVTPLRYVKENKRKRRANARERKEIRSSKPPSGVELVADNFDKSQAKEVLHRSDNKYSCLEDDEDDSRCRFSGRLMGKAKALVSFLSEDLGIQGDCELLPPLIDCGRLRSAVRGCFPSTLSCVEELSIKTVQKIEKSCCIVCRPRFDRKLDEWKEAMRRPVEVDQEHLTRFRKQFLSNIPKGWNVIPGPYIPNGSATLYHGVKDGGNWNSEPFSANCRATLVFSSGKPRVVTCYSSHNSRVLAPLHESLNTMLRRKGWLLVGDPTPDDVAGLNGDGPFLSFDYTSATDNIKTAYVSAAIDVLIDRSEGLTADQERCLRVLSQLTIEDRSELSECVRGDPSVEGDTETGFFRGQPMGSYMSFPLLCLINKTVVDLSLGDLLDDGVIGFNEWTQHRLLVNGDDLLVKEPKRRSDLKGAVVRNGLAVGLVVNEEKSGVSEEHAEINSTSFSSKGTSKEKKTNARSLYMSPDTEDVLGFAYSSTRTLKAFVRVVRANARLLACRREKYLWSLPYPYQAAVRKDKKIRKALSVEPLAQKRDLGNLFPVVEKSADYFLTREEEVQVLLSEVERVRNDAIELQRAKAMMKFCRGKKIEGNWGVHVFDVPKKPVLIKHGRSWRSLLKKKKAQRESILLCLDSAFRDKQKQSLVDQESLVSYLEVADYSHDQSLYESKIDYLIQSINSFTLKPSQVCFPQCIDLSFEIKTEVKYIAEVRKETA